MKFRQYIEKNRIIPKDFARKHGFSVSTVYNIMNGRTPFPSTAAKIEQATNGQVTVEEMIENYGK